MIDVEPVTAEAEPSLFLRLAGHPIRWRLLAELACSDRSVRELSALVGERQSLVSYHLAQLRAGALVSVRRSSFDRRDSYYAADLRRCGDLLAATGAALHPGLRLVPAAGEPAVASRAGRRRRVLFLCTGNGTRSQMAEALLERLSAGTVDVASAGSRPKPVHPEAIRAMGERGIDISAKQSKHLDRFARRRFDLVITLCDRVREVCPEFPGDPRVMHWSIPDPGAEGGAGRAQQAAFDRVAAELDGRVRLLLHLINSTAHRRASSHG
jgi:protein-tyrosine-phosphatase